MDLERSVDELAALLGGRVEGRGDRRLAALRGLERAGPDDLAAVFRNSGLARVSACRAGCLLVGAGFDVAATDRRSLVRVADPAAALEALVSAWGPADPVPAAGVHARALVEAGAELAADVSVGPFAVVGAGARVGPRSRLGAGVVLGDGARLGADVVLHPQVVVGARCVLGDRVTVHAGAVIGADGFGYRQVSGRHEKIAQVGTVIVGDDVSVGANCTIDRARFDATVIGNGCKLDDQVHIGHNCVLGEHCAIAGACTFGGSVVVGDGVMMGGCCGVRDGVTIGAGALVGGAAVITKDVAPGSFVMGNPAQPRARWQREQAVLRRLAARPDPQGREDDRGA